MARPLSDFVQDVLARGPYGAPQNVAEDAVRRTAIDLCERAGVWRFEFGWELQQGVPDYPIYTPEFTRVVAVEWVEFNKQKYRPTRQALVCACGGFTVSVPNPKTIMISPAPYAPCETHVAAKMWLAPMQEACVLPDVLWQEYSDVIADGAASRLLQMPKQDYTNQGLASRLYNLYQAGVTRAKNKRVLEYTTGPIMMRGEYF